MIEHVWLAHVLVGEPASTSPEHALRHAPVYLKERPWRIFWA
jgi:hypothetical protein